MEAIKLSSEKIINSISKEASSLKVSHKSTPKPSADNWRDVAKSLKISLTATYKEPPVCIEVVDKDGSSTYGTLGNFSAIIGKAKSRKTFLIALILAFCIKKDSTNYIQVYLPDSKKKVILIDTEQSQYHISRVVYRVLTISETVNPENFEVYGLRALQPAERLFIIEQLIYDTEDLGILVIDGIRDLISDINNPDEATMITSKLLKWTEERNIHIVTVLHQNKGDNNARGHLGSEIINKAESVISVEKDNEISKVQSEYVRGKDFNPFAFAVDQNSIPYILNDWTGKNDGKKSRPTAFDIPKETHIKALKDIFSSDVPKKYKDFESDLKVIFQSLMVKLSNVQVVEFISYYKMNRFVEDTGGKGRAGNQYTLSKTIT